MDTPIGWEGEEGAEQEADEGEERAWPPLGRLRGFMWMASSLMGVEERESISSEFRANPSFTRIRPMFVLYIYAVFNTENGRENVCLKCVYRA